MLGRLARGAWNRTALSLEEVWFLKESGADTTAAAPRFFHNRHEGNCDEF